ncbi:hypothetical protein H8959_018587 [Pygathrix nigripes]
MVVSADPLSGERAETNILEINQELRSQLAESNQQFRDLKEKFLITQATAYSLANQLKKYKNKDEDEDEMDEEIEKVQESPAPREVQKAEEKEVPQDSLEECAVTCSSSHNPSNSNQPHRSTKITFEENKVDSALVVESERFHGEEEEALNILPENENDHEEEEGKAPVLPRLSREPLRVDKHEVPQESLDGCCLTPSILPELPHSYRPYGSTSYCFEEKQVSLALVDKIQKDQEEVEDQDPPCPRLSQELPEVKEQEIPEDSVDEVYLTPSVHHDLSDCHQPYSNTLYSLEDQFACSALDIAFSIKFWSQCYILMKTIDN